MAKCVVPLLVAVGLGGLVIKMLPEMKRELNIIKMSH
jgi:hypothetical protein